MLRLAVGMRAVWFPTQGNGKTIAFHTVTFSYTRRHHTHKPSLSLRPSLSPFLHPSHPLSLPPISHRVVSLRVPFFHPSLPHINSLLSRRLSLQCFPPLNPTHTHSQGSKHSNIRMGTKPSPWWCPLLCDIHLREAICWWWHLIVRFIKGLQGSSPNITVRNLSTTCFATAPSNWQAPLVDTMVGTTFEREERTGVVPTKCEHRAQKHVGTTFFFIFDLQQRTSYPPCRDRCIT